MKSSERLVAAFRHSDEQAAGKAKVLELCLSPAKGGLELYVLRVIQGFAQAAVPAFAVVAPNGELESRLRELRLPYRLLKVAFPWFPVLAARRLARWIDAETVDIVHLHWSARELTLAVLARTFARRPVRLVYTRHIAVSRSKHDLYHRPLYRRLDLVLTITRTMQDDAHRHLPLPPERVQVLYHGVPAAPRPDEAACAQLRADAGVPEKGFVVGLFGRIEPAKGQQVLVEAMALLAGRGCEAYALLYGHPMHRRHVDDLRTRIARLGLGQRVRYRGFHPEPQRIMGCCDCVVLTTYNETFGLVLIEAMRAGTAVIGTNAGGVPEIIEHEKTGLLVPPGDASALADAIERLARAPGLRARLAAAGKAAADERFDDTRHFEQLAAWLQSVSRA